LQGFSYAEINKYKILDMVCAMRSFENIDVYNEEWLKSDVCELGFQHTDRVNSTVKRKGEENGGEDENEEEGESSERISHSIALQCADTLLDYMGQRRCKYSHITAVRKIHAAVRRSLNSSQKQSTLQTVSQSKCQLCKKKKKKGKVICVVL
jgi:hypothetical protein